MKTLYVIFAGFCLWCMTAATVGAAESDVKKLKGSWEVTVPDAPYGYQNYTIDIKEKDNAWLVDIKGGEIDVKNGALKEKDGKLSIEIYVGESVTVTIWEENGVVKGLADTTQGKMTCNFKKATQAKKK